jgi:hypothetical protein
MIDYDKRKIAYELAKKHADDKSIKYEFIYSVKDNFGKIECIFSDGRDFMGNELAIDALIQQLKQLTKPEPKYKVGDTVFFINSPFINMEVVSGVIEGFNDNAGYLIKHSLYLTCRSEHGLFHTRESLIEHQIKYWAKLFEEEQKEWLVNFIKREQPQVDIDRCQHDKIVIGAYSRSNPPMKCIKCGEFYR